MAYTGYLVIQYIDDNPNSSGYGEIWTERVLDTTHCPNDSGEWTLISDLCQLDTSGYTGYKTATYYNNITGEYSSTTRYDSTCTESSLEEDWRSIDSYCEVVNEKYTGYNIQVQRQVNHNLANFGETREVKELSETCLEHLKPIWVTVSKECNSTVDEYTGFLIYDGTADIVQMDVNPSSSGYNTFRTITVEDSNCFFEVCDDVEFEWRYIDDYCGSMVPEEYNLWNLSGDAIYHIYREYKKCYREGGLQSVRPTDIYSAVTYQTGVDYCVNRWVETDETVCVEPWKFRGIITDGTSYYYPCNTSTTITESEVQSVTNSAYLKTVEISDCCTSIGQLAFWVKKWLTAFTFSNTILSLDVNAICNCPMLKSITIPSSLTTTSSNGSPITVCPGLESIVVDSNNSYFDSRNNCNAIINSSTNVLVTGCKTTIIPSSVVEIGKRAFYGCSGMTSITIPNSVTKINDSAFLECSGLTSIDIPDSVTIIGSNTFEKCSSLSNVSIGTGITSIGGVCFNRCSNLSSVTLTRSTPPTLGTGAFLNTNNTFKIYVPSGSVNAYKSASEWSDYASRIQAIP